MSKFIGLVMLVMGLFSCTREEESETLFQKLSGEETGILFINELELSPDFDVFRYRNYYNGGGVAIGDINGDGLSDVFLTSNMGDNKLYLNKGDFRFEDISDKAGIKGTKEWSTGVSMADVNGDGWLDIYVCNSGDVLGGNRDNELYINNGDLTFTEKAAAFGLADKGFGTHAVFFDYDQDGDLDCYILNNSFRPVSSLGLENIRHVRDSTGADKLYKNNGNTFEDVSESAGIYGSVIGFGLGVTITDINLDNWLDIYVSNDFFERDYLYVNQKDGTFKEELAERTGHISNFSMGTDAADLNNDGAPEIFVTDMLPDNDKRLKTTTNFDSYDRHQVLLANDYYEQYMRNTLQLNDGSGNFKEIGQLAGVHATDWSWGAILADFDNDSYKDIYVTNGIYKDVTNQDFIDYLASDEMIIPSMRTGKVNFEELVNKMPSTKLSNYLFTLDSGMKYKNVAQAWGLGEPSFSNGAAYGDLDNDGDLDLVVNNVNQEAFVYRNNTDRKGKKSLTLNLKGYNKNTYAVGARINLYAGGKTMMFENVPTKGFQSSMDYKIVIGCDTLTQLDSLDIFWGYGKYSKLKNVATNQKLTVDFKEAIDAPQLRSNLQSGKNRFNQIPDALTPSFNHQEDLFVDFDRERMIYHMVSREGPALAAGDVNGDGLDDFYIGGAAGQHGQFYIQQTNRKFRAANVPDVENDARQEDVDAVFFDADNDGDLDLYVVSGGYSYYDGAEEYNDRLYINNSVGNKIVFTKSTSIPRLVSMGSCVKPADFDKDGDIDLFVGGRAVPGKYGLAADSHILLNEGNGAFRDVTSSVAPRLFNLGMVTDASWVDFDNDNDLDLIVVGDWLPITLFKNNGRNLERLNNVPGLVKSEGWWNSIEVKDINKDGNVDFIVGNWGLNNKFSATKEKPVTLFVADFDENETLDQIFAYYQGDSLYPMTLRHDLVRQISAMKGKFLYFSDYAGKTVEQVFGKEKLDNALEENVYQLASSVVMNRGDGSYQVKPLPLEVQFSPIFSIVQLDSTALLLTGNFHGVKPEEGRYDSNDGIMLGFNDQSDPSILGNLGTKGEVRNARVLRSAGGKRILVLARNNDTPLVYEF